MEEYGTGYDLEDEAADQEEGVREEAETDPEEPELEGNPEEGTVEGQPEEAAGEPGEDPGEETGEGEPEEEPEDDPETVSGNDIVISGDLVVFPEGYDFSGSGSEAPDTEAIVQAIEKQDEILTAGFACTCFLLGMLAGAMIIAGFRLRRV